MRRASCYRCQMFCLLQVSCVKADRMALNRSLIASHLHLFFTLSVVVSFPNMETLYQIWKCFLSFFVFALNRFTANSVKLFLLFYLSSY